MQRDKLMKTLTLPEPGQLQEGETYNVLLTHFISPYEFYVRIVSIFLYSLCY